MKLTREYIEAINFDSNKKRAEFKNNSSAETRKRLEALEEADALLKKAGVPFYLFGYIPFSKKPSENLFMQFNSIAETVAFDPNDKSETVQIKKISEFNSAMIYSLYSMFFAPFLHGKDPVESSDFIISEINRSVDETERRIYRPDIMKEFPCEIDIEKFISLYEENIHFNHEENRVFLLNGKKFVFLLLKNISDGKFYWYLKSSEDTNPIGSHGCCGLKLFTSVEDGEKEINKLIESVS